MMMLNLLEEKIETSKFNYLEALYFMNEFTFGFELEGWALSPSLKDDFNYYASKYFNNLENNLPEHKKTINTSTMSLGEDSTISVDHDLSQDCYFCDGEGRVRCEECHGEGRVRCINCEDGIINTVCEACNGTGYDPNYDSGLFGEKVPCSKCNGEGKIEKEQTCSECDGEGSLSCPECGGEGYRECPKCGGNGNEYIDSDDVSYEWKSPIFNFNMENIQHVIKFLYSCLEQGYLRTNDSCGFHVHIGLPDKLLLNENRLWVLIKLALKDNGEFIKKFFIYKTGNYDIHFTDSRYADTNIVENIKRYAKVVENIEDIYNLIKTAYKGDKFVVFGQHPQGTLEWRGPRGFLDEGEIKIIKGFFLNMLYPLVKFFSDAMEETSLVINNVTISKKDFDLYVKETLGYKVPIINKRRLEDKRFDWEGQKKYSNMQYINEVLKSNKWLLKQETHFTNMLIQKDDEKYLMSDGSFRNSIIESSNNLIFDNVSFSYNCNLHQNFYNQINVDDECYILDGNFINSSIHYSKIMNGNFEGCTFQYRPYIDNTCLIKDGTFVNCLFCFSSKNNINNLYTYYNGFKNVKNSKLFLKGSSPVNIDNHIKIPNNIQNINDIILFISDALKQIPINNKKNEIMNYRNIELDESFYDYLYELYNI